MEENRARLASPTEFEDYSSVFTSAGVNGPFMLTIIGRRGAMRMRTLSAGHVHGSPRSAPPRRV